MNKKFCKNCNTETGYKIEIKSNNRVMRCEVCDTFLGNERYSDKPFVPSKSLRSENVEESFIERKFRETYEHFKDPGNKKFIKCDPNFTLKQEQPIKIPGKFYWADFYEPIHKICVELDSIDWHFSTNEQIERTLIKHNYLEKNGFPVLHFTGSQITTNPVQALATVYQTYLNLENGKTPDDF